MTPDEPDQIAGRSSYLLWTVPLLLFVVLIAALIIRAL